MENKMETWYIITRWNRENYETDDPEHARLAVREGSDVTKITRAIFQHGASLIRTTVSTDISKIKDV